MEHPELPVQCPSEAWFKADDPGQVATFKCRREKGHMGNHSTARCETDYGPKDMTNAARPFRIDFRLDWRPQDGLVLQLDPIVGVPPEVADAPV